MTRSRSKTLTANSSWWPMYSPSCALSRSARWSLRKRATASGLFSTVPDPIRAATPFTGFLSKHRVKLIARDTIVPSFSPSSKTQAYVSL
jgi:hypothetical protein